MPCIRHLFGILMSAIIVNLSDYTEPGAKLLDSVDSTIVGESGTLFVSYCFTRKIVL